MGLCLRVLYLHARVAGWQNTWPFRFLLVSVSVTFFDLVHSDVRGPAPSSSLGGFSYYICFIDDFSRYTWLYLMRSRSEVFSVYCQFTQMIHTQFGKRIKVFRSDGVREYLSTSFRDLLSSHGTLANTTAQNGVAERKHRHILETTRAQIGRASCRERVCLYV